MLDELITGLKTWQELAGAIIGGFLALVVAVIVARDARHREERTNAMLVISGLLRMRAAFEGAEELVDRKTTDLDEHLFGMAAVFSMQPPLPSERFDEAAAMLLYIDEHLAAHLSMVDTVLCDVRLAVQRWVRDQEEFSRSSYGKLMDRRPGASDDATLPRARGDMLVDARTIHRGMVTLVQHTECIERMLGLLVLSPFRTFHTLRMFLWDSNVEKRCKKALQTGSFTESGPATN